MSTIKHTNRPWHTWMVTCRTCYLTGWRAPYSFAFCEECVDRHQQKELGQLPPAPPYRNKRRRHRGWK